VIEYVDVSNFENKIDINRNNDETNCCIRVVVGSEDGKDIFCYYKIQRDICN
jgi:hypothetical protein